MGTLLLVLLSLSLSALVAIFLKHYQTSKHLPPGPPAVPILGNLLWLTNSLSTIEPLLCDLHARYGPIVTLRIGSSITIFVSDRRLAHEALVEHGIVFAGRPKPSPLRKILGNNSHSITSAPYGPLWRLLRRNLAAEILQPSRVKVFSGARAWVLDVLLSKLRSPPGGVGSPGAVMESFQFAMFCLLVLMCFGEKLGEEQVKAIERAQRHFLLYSRKLNVFAICPGITKYLFRSRWNSAVAMRQRQRELYLPLIRARRAHKAKREEESEERFVHSYVDSLLDIEIQDEGGRKLTDEELVVLCSEFLNAGTDTTSTALQWIMAELVQHQDVQQKLLDEIQQVFT